MSKVFLVSLYLETNKIIGYEHFCTNLYRTTLKYNNLIPTKMSEANLQIA